MEALSVREYRNRLALCFDKASEGEKILIRRKNQLYTLVSLGPENITLDDQQQHKIDKLSASIKKSWQEIKEIESGKRQPKSALDFLDEL